MPWRRRGWHPTPTRDLRGALTAPTVTHYGAITEASRVGELLRAIDGYDGQGHTKLAMQIAPHLFVRPGELRHADWSEVDLDAALWTIPPEKMKMRKAHHVPLSRQAVALFREVQEAARRPTHRGDDPAVEVLSNGVAAGYKWQKVVGETPSPLPGRL